MSDELETLRRVLARERAARKAAEQLLEQKSLELYEATQRAEQSRRAAEHENERLRSLGEAAPDLIFAVTVDGRVTFRQRRAGDDEGVARHLTGAVRAAVSVAVATGQLQRVAQEGDRGEHHDVFVSPIGADEAMVLVRDVTLERQMSAGLLARVDEAQAARASLERALSDTLAAMNAGFWEVDLSTGAHTWADTTFRLLGLEPGSVVPSTEVWRQRIHPDDFEHLSMRTLPRKATRDFRVVLPDGRERWCRSVVSTVFSDDGRPTFFRGITSDVTDERATLRQLARMAEVANRTENAVIVTDLEGRIEWVNAAFEAMTEWSLAEVEGKKPGALLQGPHSDRAAVGMMRAAIAARRAFHCEVLNYARSGRQYWVQIECRPAVDAAGEAIGFVAIESDVTDRRIAAARNHIAQRVAALLLASEALEAAATGVVRELVSELDVVAAQFWVVDPASPALQYVAGAVSRRGDGKGQAFIDATRGIEYRAGFELVRGVGIPGAAWGTRRTVLQRDFTVVGPGDVAPSRRLQAAAAAGINTVCATPVLGPSSVLGVIEIAGTAYYPGHDRLSSLLERVAEQIASFLLHDASRRSFQSIFDQSPDGLLLVDERGAVRDGNARAVELFGEVRGAALAALIEGAGELVNAGARAGRGAGGDAAAGGADVARSGALFNRAANGAKGSFSAEVSVSVTPSSTTQAAIVAVRDLTERHRVDAEIKRSLREKETLLREVHHRVKNNLQIVSSLLTLQSETIDEPDARRALSEMVFRVRSMSFVHQQLYGTDNLGGIDFSEYARTLCNSLQGSVDPNARISFELEAVEISVDTAVPCGLILNELVTNALKHGRASDGSCDVLVEVRVIDASTFSLTVSDRGPGFGATKPSPTSLGMQLIRSLSRQLRAKTEMGGEAGARVTLRVPVG